MNFATTSSATESTSTSTWLDSFFPVVLLVANRGVGTRDRDNHDLLALPLVVRLKGGGDTADLTRVELRSPGNETELGVRNDSAFLSSLGEVRI